MGEAGGVAGECSQVVKEAFNNMHFIVTVGWSIYAYGRLHFHTPLIVTVGWPIYALSPGFDCISAVSSQVEV